MYGELLRLVPADHTMQLLQQLMALLFSLLAAHLYSGCVLTTRTGRETETMDAARKGVLLTILHGRKREAPRQEIILNGCCLGVI